MNNFTDLIKGNGFVYEASPRPEESIVHSHLRWSERPYVN